MPSFHGSPSLRSLLSLLDVSYKKKNIQDTTHENLKTLNKKKWDKCVTLRMPFLKITNIIEYDFDSTFKQV